MRYYDNYNADEAYTNDCEKLQEWEMERFKEEEIGRTRGRMGGEKVM